MKFETLTINNFGAIGKAEVELNNRGLVLIQGENQHNTAANSNGAGKSTIVEAISWVLYGKTAKGQTGDSVINRSIGKGCSVELVLNDDNGDQYLISRGRKHKTLKSKLHVTLTDGANVHDLTKGTDKLTQEVVEQIIGCPYDVFIGAVYAGQEQMPDLPNMTDKHLKLLIEEAAGITLLENAHAIARQRLNDRKLKVDAAERDIANAEVKATRAQERLDDAKSSVIRWNAERDARVIDLETKARVLLRDAKAHKKELGSLKSEETITAAQNKLKERLDKVDRENTELKRLQDDWQIAANQSITARNTSENAVAAVQLGKERLDEAMSSIGKPCADCGRIHDADTLKVWIAASKDDLADNKNSARDAIKAYKKVAEQEQTASLSASSFKADMTDMKSEIALSEALSQQLAKTVLTKNMLRDALTRAKDLTASVRKEGEKENPYEADVKTRTTEQMDADDEVRSAKAALRPIQKALNVARDVVEVYSPKGVRAHILDSVTPYLNDRTAHYLGALADGEFEAIWQTITLTAKGEARENFSIQVKGDDGEGSFTDLSGGEKRKVRVACALALQDLVATRATKSLDLFIADEIDAALDASALERLMIVLDEKAKERGSVFIISHSDLRDWVSNVMTVVKENGEARIAA